MTGSTPVAPAPSAPLRPARRRHCLRALFLLIGWLLALASALADETRPAASSGLPFSGLAIGDPLAKLEPHFHAPDTGAPTCHRESGIVGHLTCQYEGARDDAAIGWAGDVPYTVLGFDYLKDQLIGFNLWIEVGNYAVLHARLGELYGAPRSEDSSIIYDSRGRALDQVVSMWRTSAGVLELDKRSWSVEQSRLSLTAVSGQNEIITNDAAPDENAPAGENGNAAQDDSGSGGAAQGGVAPSTGQGDDSSGGPGGLPR